MDTVLSLGWPGPVAGPCVNPLGRWVLAQAHECMSRARRGGGPTEQWAPKRQRYNGGSRASPPYIRQ